MLNIKIQFPSTGLAPIEYTAHNMNGLHFFMGTLGFRPPTYITELEAVGEVTLKTQRGDIVTVSQVLAQ